MSKGYQWGYSNENGPHTWVKHFPKATGPRQSPILINSAKAEKDEQLLRAPLKVNIGDSGAQSVINTGHGFRVDVVANDLTITGGPLAEDTYRIAQFHFHWGECDGWGSEHILDGRVFASELHCVFWNTRYPNIGEAVEKSDGLAVLGSFIEVGAKNPALEPLVGELEKITFKDSSTLLQSPVDLQQILPKCTKEYYTYKGSLTTPPCNESVTWFVFKEPISMSSEQLNAFRSLCHGGEGSHPIVDNFRPVCPLGDRPLLRTF